MKTRRKAREEKEKVRKGQFPHLPREIWEKICDKLTMKEVVQSLSSSCMALHGLPLDSICLTTSLSESTSRLSFHWLMKHMQGATQVTYKHLPQHLHEFTCRPHKDLDMIRKQGCGTLPNLQMLSLEIDDMIREWSLWMIGILKLAPNLVGLQLKLTAFPPRDHLPVMANLRHLSISVDSLSRSLPWCLSQLHCLKTLELSRKLSCSSHTTSFMQLPDSLEALCLRHILPIGLQPPSSCRVTVTGLSCCLDNTSELQDWQTLRPATTHLVIHAVSESFEWDDRSISALPRLEALTLIATDGRQVIGNMGLELPDPGAASMYNDLYVHSLPGEQLRHLTSLTVVAHSICITLPAALRLQRVCMCARNKLCLHFESAEETARHLRAFDIACSCLLHPDPIDALQRGLQKRDIQLMKVYSCQIQMLHVCSSPRPDADTCWFRDCSCMCCSQCLAKSGAMVMRGADTRSAVPPAILGMTAPMAHMEEGCEASPWVGSLPCPFQPGSPDSNHGHMCIEDASDLEDDESDTGTMADSDDGDLENPFYFPWNYIIPIDVETGGHLLPLPDVDEEFSS